MIYSLPGRLSMGSVRPIRYTSYMLLKAILVFCSAYELKHVKSVCSI